VVQGRAIAVVGAVGGVGASTLAALLARRLGATRPVALVDLDAGHGGLEVLLGTERADGARWPDLAGLRGPLAPSDLRGVLPRWGPVEVLSWDRRGAEPDGATVAAVLAGLLDAGRTVVLDVPARAAGEALRGVRADEAAGVTGGARVVVVTGQDVLGVAAAARLLGCGGTGPGRDGGLGRDGSLGRDAGLGPDGGGRLGGDGAGAGGTWVPAPPVPPGPGASGAVRHGPGWLGPGWLADARPVLAVRRRPGARVAPAQVGATVGLPVACLVPTDRRVAGAVDRGLGPAVARWAPLARAVARLARALGEDGRG